MLMVERVGKSFETWMLSLEGKSESVRRNYPRLIEEFLTSKSWSYEDLFEKYLSAIRSQDPRDKAAITNVIVNFCKEKRKQGYSSGTAKNYLKAIISFLQENGLEFRLLNGQRKDLSVETLKDKDNFTKDEIRTMLECTTSLRSKAIVNTLKDSGMRVSDLNDLKVRDVLEAINNKEKFAVIEYIQNKTKRRAVAVLGYEALESIEKWLKWRSDNGFSVAPDTPLFIEIEPYDRGGESPNDSKIMEELHSGKPLKNFFRKPSRKG